MNRKPLYYLASPISHSNQMVVDLRHSQCVDSLAQFYHHGWMVYSPHVHHRAIAPQMPRSWDFWAEPSFAFLDRCDAMIVLMLGEWEKSHGMKAEVIRAREQHKVVMYVDYPLEWTQDGIKCTVVNFSRII